MERNYVDSRCSLQACELQALSSLWRLTINKSCKSCVYDANINDKRNSKHWIKFRQRIDGGRTWRQAPRCVSALSFSGSMHHWNRVLHTEAETIQNWHWTIQNGNSCRLGFAHIGMCGSGHQAENMYQPKPPTNCHSAVGHVGMQPHASLRAVDKLLVYYNPAWVKFCRVFNGRTLMQPQSVMMPTGRCGVPYSPVLSL